MANEPITPEPNTPAADGYYAEDAMGDDELDLSFLDEKDTDKK